jgi:hypothetical protein
VEGYFIKVAKKRGRQLVVIIPDLLAVSAEVKPEYIQINKISIDLNLPRTYIWYSQVLKDSEGNVVPSNLPTPEWLINVTFLAFHLH